jgi:hypothetical protein
MGARGLAANSTQKRPPDFTGGLSLGRKRRGPHLYAFAFDKASPIILYREQSSELLYD